MPFFPKKSKLLPRDEFIERILCTVPGMTPPANLYLLDKAIAGMTDDSGVLEIGSFAGQSAIIIHYLLQKHKKKGKIVCVDPFMYEGWEDAAKEEDSVYMHAVGNNAAITRENYLQFVENSFRQNVSFFCPGNTPMLYKMKSDDFFIALNEGKFPELRNFHPGFCHIDGDHGKQATLNDARNCVSISAKNAFLLIDDSYRKISLGSGEAVKEIREWKNMETIAENPNFLLRKK